MRECLLEYEGSIEKAWGIVQTYGEFSVTGIRKSNDY